MDTIHIPLNKLPIGNWAKITLIQTEGLTRRRLLDLGFVPGSRIKSIQRSPAGNPTAFNIRGSIIALRNDDASQILVQKEN